MCQMYANPKSYEFCLPSVINHTNIIKCEYEYTTHCVLFYSNNLEHDCYKQQKINYI